MNGKPLQVAALSLALAACSAKPPQAANPALSGPPNLPVPEVPARSRWALDPENSSVTFLCKHVFANVRGLFPQPVGTVTFDEADATHSEVQATVSVQAVSTGVQERDTHLQSPDFFDAARFPEATFRSTRVSPLTGGNFVVAGELTLHGVTRPVTLTAVASAPFQHAGGVRRGIEATTALNRRDFGLTWDFPGEGPGVVVGDLIQLTIDAELVLQP